MCMRESVHATRRRRDGAALSIVFACKKKMECKFYNLFLFYNLLLKTTTYTNMRRI